MAWNSDVTGRENLSRLCFYERSSRRHCPTNRYSDDNADKCDCIWGEFISLFSFLFDAIHEGPNVVPEYVTFFHWGIVEVEENKKRRNVTESDMIFCLNRKTMYEAV